MQNIALLSATILYFTVKTHKARCCLILMCLYSGFTHIIDVFVGEVSDSYYLIESIMFSIWAAWVAFRPKLTIHGKPNPDNILLAFYRGEGGSPLMDIFSLFGFPVKSMCLVAGEHTLMLRSNRDNFQFSKNSESIIGNDDYIIIDTGKKWDDEFKLSMSKCARKKAKAFGFRICCVVGVGELLSEVDKSWKPKRFYDNIPSVYLYKALNR